MSEQSQFVDRLVSSKMTREAYVRSKVCTNLSSQVRALRRRDKLTQQEFAKRAEMKQSRISAIERPGTSFNTETLVRLSAAFGVGLQIRFVSYSEMLAWENSFSQDEFNVLRLEDDAEFREGFIKVEDYERWAGLTSTANLSNINEGAYVWNTTAGTATYVIDATAMALLGNQVFSSRTTPAELR